VEQHFVDLLSSLPLHVVLLLAIFGLCRDNRRLHAKIEDCLGSIDELRPKIDDSTEIDNCL